MKVKPRCTTIIRKARTAQTTENSKIELVINDKIMHTPTISIDEEMIIATVDL